MDAQRWKQVRDLFDAALEQPVHLRDRFLAARTIGDPRLAQEVRDLLSSYQESDHLLTQPAVKGLEALLPGVSGGDATVVPDLDKTLRITPNPLMAPLAPTGSAGMAGRRMGLYRLIKELGPGPAGPVFLAARDDRQSDQRVAITVLPPGANAGQFAERVLEQQRGPAGLEHPNIARFLDGGINHEGLPYLVIEHVEGVRLDEYCEGQHLGTAPRLRLFVTVCDAVHYLHSHLAIHGDLKPENILVTSAGVPRILYSGIARLASNELPAGSLRTTDDDNRALGGLLESLLPADEPRPAGLDARLQAARLMTPQQACLSADALAREVSAWLDTPPPSVGLAPKPRSAPVVPGGRSSSSITIAAAAAAMALLAAAGAGVYSTNRARQERDAAEQRLRSVDDFGRFILLDFNDALRQSEPAARKRLVPKALDFLDKLAAQAPADPAKQREIIEGYLNVGAMQRDIDGPDAGESQGARVTLQTAQRMAEALAAQNPSDETDVVLAARANAEIAGLFASSGEHREAITRYQHALSLLDPLVRNRPLSATAAALLLDVSQCLGSVHFEVEDFNAAVADYTRAHETAAQLLKAKPTDTGAERSVAATLKGMGEAYSSLGKSIEALPRLTEARTILERLLNADPSQPQRRQEVAAASLALGDALAAAGRPAEAAPAFRRALMLAEGLAAANRQNRQLQRDVPAAMGRLAETLLQTGAGNEAHDLTKRSLEALWPLVDTSHPEIADLRLYVRLLVTTPFDDLRSPARALPYAQQLVELTKASQPAALDLLAQALFASGDAAKALEFERKALALLARTKPGESPSALRRNLEANMARFSQGAAGTALH